MKWHLATHTVSAAAVLLFACQSPSFTVSIEAGHVSEFNYEAMADSSLCIWVRETSHTTRAERKLSPLPSSKCTFASLLNAYNHNISFLLPNHWEIFHFYFPNIRISKWVILSPKHMFTQNWSYFVAIKSSFMPSWV